MKIDRLKWLKASASHLYRRAGRIVRLVGRDCREQIDFGRAGKIAHAAASKQRTQTGRRAKAPILIDGRSGSRNKGSSLFVRPWLQQVHRSSTCTAHDQNAAIVGQQRSKVLAARCAATHRLEGIGPLAEDLSRSKIILSVVTANYGDSVIGGGCRSSHAGRRHGRTG